MSQAVAVLDRIAYTSKGLYCCRSVAPFSLLAAGTLLYSRDREALQRNRHETAASSACGQHEEAESMS